jgi:hypothetical protein
MMDYLSGDTVVAGAAFGVDAAGVVADTEVVLAGGGIGQ